jgi:hypothetical protein
MGVIYKITNVLDGKVYIGQTMRKFEERKREHLRSFKDSKSQTVLIKAVLKHGVNNFNFEVVEECNNDQIDEKEIYYIKQYNSKAPNGYNVRSGGREKPNTTNSNRHTVAKPVYQYTIEGDFIKEFISSTQAGVELNIQNSVISKCCRGEGLSSGGFRWSREKIDKLEPIIKYTNIKPVYQYTIDGKFIKEFKSTREAEIELNISTGAINDVCLGIRHKTGGFRWSREKIDKLKPIIRYNIKPVYQYTIEGKFIKEFKSTREAEIELNISARAINQVCIGRRHTTGGFRWSREKIDKLKLIRKK